MNLTVTVPPPFEPVTLRDVYDHLRLDADGSPLAHPDDLMLTRHIQTAREQVELMTRRALVRQTLRLSMRSLPETGDALQYMSTQRRMQATTRIVLPRPPIASVLAVSYYGPGNALETIDPATYYVTDTQVSELRFVNGAPGLSLEDRPDAVRIEYVAGHEPEGSPPQTQADYAANIPRSLKDAVLVGVQMLYDSLTPPEYERLEKLREALVQPYRIQHV
jgi:uncharacterized phiE125 gp8 family phage protein